MLESILGTQVTLSVFLICTAVSLALGLGVALLCMYRSRYTASFVITLVILPAMVQMIIMLVNGNIGAGVAVSGVFALVRFRSLPGTAREIGMIFLAMVLGLATGMGYLALAVIFFLIVAVFFLLLSLLHFGEGHANERELKITIPENLDYDGLFDDLFKQYTKSARLDRVKTTNMGTLYELDYRIVLPGETVPKEFLDALRCRNGNLNIICGRVAAGDTL